MPTPRFLHLLMLRHRLYISSAHRKNEGTEISEQKFLPECKRKTGFKPPVKRKRESFPASLECYGSGADLTGKNRSFLGPDSSAVKDKISRGSD